MITTKDFLKLVLPPEGHKFLAIPMEGKKGYRHTSHTNISVLANSATQLDELGQTVFYALASYKEDKVWHEVDQKYKRRTHDNAGWVKALWLDLDCGEGKGYPDQRSALQDIVRFVKETGLPAPTAVVNSGNGLHVYWVFDEAITADRWIKIASYWKAVVTHFKVKHDPARTADISSVLRPVGVHHRKAEPKPVTLVGQLRPVVSVVSLVQQLAVLVREHSLTIRSTKAPSIKRDSINSDLTSGNEYPDSYAAIIAGKCEQIRYFEASGGQVEEPYWYAVLGLLKHCVDGVELAHQWSSGDPRYTPEDTQAKMDQWTYGPPSCEKFAGVNSDGCKDCKRKINSPISLGQPEPENTAVKVVVEDGVTEPTVLAIPESLAWKYRWDGALKTSSVVDDEQVWDAFCDALLVPTAYYRHPEQGYTMTIHVQHARGHDVFDMPVRLIGTGGRDLFSRLGEMNVTCTGKKQMETYLIDWQVQLKKEVDETNTYHQFGWQADNSILIGTRNYRPDGTVKTVRVHSNAAKLTDKLDMSGDVATWTELVDRAYNYDGQEQYQFMLGAGFGSMLMPLFKGKFPSIISAVSYGSGLGKSSVEAAAMGVWGNPQALEMAKGQTTSNALYARLGTMGNLPFMYDEVTNIGAVEASQLAYTVSQGISKDRLNRGGELQEGKYTWNNLMLTSGNRSLIATIGAGKAAAEGEIARIFEFHFRDSSTLPKWEADQIFGALSDNYGVAGDVFARYLVVNRDKVQKRLFEVQQFLDKKAGISKRERFWSAAAAAVLTGLIVAKELGLVRFDLKQLTAWVVMQIREMQGTLQDNSVDSVDVWGQMLNSLANGFIITDILGDLRTGRTAGIMQRPTGEIVGRVVMDLGVAYIQQAAIRRWCDKAQVDFKNLRENAVMKGYIHPATVQVALGKGTGIQTAPTNCFELNWDRAAEGTVFAGESLQRGSVRAVK